MWVTLPAVERPPRGPQGPLWTAAAARTTVDVPRSAVSPATYHGGMAGSRLSAVPSRARSASGGRSAAFFDLDKTIIAKSSSLAFSKPFQAGGLITRRAMLRSAYAQFVYLVGGADHDQMEKIRAFMSQLVEGWDVETVKEIVAETLHHVVDPIVYDEAVSLMEEHREAGRDVVVVSASGTEVVEPIGEMLGADDVIASRLEIVDGKYTGEIDYYAYAEEKARAIAEMAAERGYDLEDCFAYSDSITDAPMLDVVGHPHAVNPDKELRRLAAAKGWPVLQFTPPGHAAQPHPGQAHPRGADRRHGAHGRRRDLAQPPPQARGLARLTATRAATARGLQRDTPAQGGSQSQGLPDRSDRRTQEGRTPQAAREPGTHAAIHPSYRAHVIGILPGLPLGRCTLGSRVRVSAAAPERSGAARMSGLESESRRGLASAPAAYASAQ